MPRKKTLPYPHKHRSVLIIRTLITTTIIWVTFYSSLVKAQKKDLENLCHENGGTWKVSAQGVRGCLCSDGHYLQNVYFEVCQTTTTKVRRHQLKHNSAGGPKSDWSSHGTAWSLSGNRRSKTSPLETIKEFVRNVNMRDLDSAWGLVNDFEVHPSRNIEGVSELLKKYSQIDFREWDLATRSRMSQVAEPQKQLSGCLYTEESISTLVNEQKRGIGKVHIYCTHFSALKEGQFKLDQAIKFCPQYKPRHPQFKCKIGYMELFND